MNVGRFYLSIHKEAMGNHLQTQNLPQGFMFDIFYRG